MFSFKKIIEYGLYLIVFLFPIQTRLFLRLGETEYSTISLYGIDILIFIILLFHIYIIVKKFASFDFPTPTIWWLIAGFDLFIFISIFFAPDKILALYRYGIFLLGVALFWLIVSAHYNRIKLAWSFILGLSFQACLSIWQFFSQVSFASKWLGMAQHNAGKLGVSVIETLDGERWLRAYGGFDHPNILGGAMAAGLLVLISLIIAEIRNKKQALSKFSIFNFQFSILFLTIYSLLFTALLFSFSRSAWIGFAFGVFILFLFYLIEKKYLKLKALLKFILLGAILVFTFYSIYPGLFQVRISGEARLEIKSNQERIVSLQESKEIIRNNLLFGTGIGNYTLTLAEKYPNRSGFEYQPPHNVFLLVLSEIGILGFLFFVFCLLFIFTSNYQKRNYANIAILFSIVFMMSLDHWWWSLHFGVLFFWFILGLLYNKNTNN